MKHFTGLLAILTLSACASASGDYKTYLAQKSITTVTAQKFEHCRGYGCRIIDKDLTLSDQDWQEIEVLFMPSPRNAAEERKRTAAAIGVFEQKVGTLTGTDNDVKGTYLRLGDHQHDCVDESVNTTIYLSLLEQKGLLAFHSVASPTSRVPLLSRGFGFHQTGVVTEIANGKQYAVDSWFHDNGHPAEIVALGQWFYGWRP